VKKRTDPLWKIVGEEVSLQGSEQARRVACPRCNVVVELPGETATGDRFRCGLCGTVSEVVSCGLVADDGSPEVVARLAQ
jgi:ribosomal protein S27AE